MNWDELFPVITPSAIALFGVLVGYLLKFYLDKKAKFSSDTATIKRDMYEKYIDFMMKFVQDSKNQTANLSDKQTKEIISRMREFHRKAILYSSPKVIEAFANFMQLAYKSSDNNKLNGTFTMVLVTNVFKEMRRDIGLSNRGLRGGAIRLIRPIINDYDQVVAPIEFSLFNNAKRAAESTKQESEAKQ